MTLLREAAAIAAKDLRIETRGRHGLTVVLPFAATLLIAFGLSLGPGRARLEALAPALLWLATLFASVMAFRRSYEAELEDDAIEGLILSPADRAAVFLGKGAAVWVQLVLLQAAVTLLVGFLFGAAPGWSPSFVASILLGTAGLSAVGSLFGVVAAAPRARESVLPIVVFPLSVPVLLAGIGSIREASAGWLGLLAAFDAVFVALGMLAFGTLVEE